MMAASGKGAALVLPPRFCARMVMGNATASPINGMGVCSGMPRNMPLALGAAAAPRLLVAGSAEGAMGRHLRMRCSYEMQAHAPGKQGSGWHASVSPEPQHNAAQQQPAGTCLSAAPVLPPPLLLKIRRCVIACRADWQSLPVLLLPALPPPLVLAMQPR